MKKEKPILFSPSMVDALMKGKKTQTRRIKGKDLNRINQCPSEWSAVGFFQGVESSNDYISMVNSRTYEVINLESPYGNIGEDLWVRETWRVCGWDFDGEEMNIEYLDGSKNWVKSYDPTNDCQWLMDYIENLERKKFIKCPDDHDIEKDGEDFQYEFLKPFPWKPSIHMPREASRTSLRIVSWKVQRLQGIIANDSRSEGIEEVFPYGEKSPSKYYRVYGKKKTFTHTQYARTSFKSLWDSINGEPKKDGTMVDWKTNPWVFVITYEID